MDGFEQRMAQICSASEGALPLSAIPIMELLFTDRTKEMLVKSCFDDKELADAIAQSIYSVENGCMETVDSLVRKKLHAAICRKHNGIV